MGLMKWFKNKLFEGDIVNTVGSIDGFSKGMVKTKLIIHALRLPDAKTGIGLELVAKSPLSYQMQPISLSVEAVHRLQEYLTQVLHENRPC